MRHWPVPPQALGEKKTVERVRQRIERVFLFARCAAVVTYDPGRQRLAVLRESEPAARRVTVAHLVGVYTDAVSAQQLIGDLLEHVAGVDE